MTKLPILKCYKKSGRWGLFGDLIFLLSSHSTISYYSLIWLGVPWRTGICPMKKNQWKGILELSLSPPFQALGMHYFSRFPAVTRWLSVHCCCGFQSCCCCWEHPSGSHPLVWLPELQACGEHVCKQYRAEEEWTVFKGSGPHFGTVYFVS